MKIKLSDKKQRWVKNRDVILRGDRLNYNAAIQSWYVRNLRKLIKQMSNEVSEEVMALFKRVPAKPIGATDESLGSQARILMNALAEKFENLFSISASTLSEQMVNRTVKASSNSIESSLKSPTGGLSIKTNAIPAGLTDIINASIAENVSLIKSIPQQYLKNVTGAVMRSVTSGEGLYELMPIIKKYARTTERRAELLALDQTRKAYTSINVAKLEQIGAKKFQWLHSGGGQTPRESHIKIDGEVFSFENLLAEQAAKGVPKEDRGLPGYPVNCRCTLKAIFEFKKD